MYLLTRFLFLLSIFAFSCSAALAQTENTVITGGVALQHSCCDMSFNLTGEGFAVKASVAGYLNAYRDGPGGAPAMTLPPGSSLYVRTTYNDFFGTNTATFKGITYYPVYHGGYWEITFGPVAIPDIQAPVVTLTTPFNMTGRLEGLSISYQSARRPDHVIFDTNLTGKGIATMQLTGRTGSNGWEYRLVNSSIIFNFQSAADLPETIRLSSTNYTAHEDDPSGAVTIAVNRVGDTSSAATVDYLTKDAGVATCEEANPSPVASGRCDYGTTVGTLRFAPGEVSKTIQIPIINDAYVETAEGFSISLRNAQGGNLGANASAAVIILDNDTQTAARNPIEDQAFFIRQQYIDFLGRMPEPAGFNFWNNRMNNCPPGQVCDRIDTSLRFFQSDEFQAGGFYIYRLHDAVLGFLPRYERFVSDLGRLSGSQSVQEQRQSKDAYLLDFINDNYFKFLYSSYLEADGLRAKDAAGFVNALCEKAGITPASKQTLINNLQSGARDVAHTVEDFINTPEISGKGTKFYDRGFITMQYYGYLRRDPEQAGFDFWVSQLIGPNAPHRQDYRFMVGGFLQSDEYNFRFARISSVP